MKKNLLMFFVILLLLSCASDIANTDNNTQTNNNVSNSEVVYLTSSNIYYRDSLDIQNDNYKKEKCMLDVYYPLNKKDLTTIVFFHGGGLTSGDKYIPNAFKNKNVIVVSANYRLSPNVYHPAYIEDAGAVVSWAFNNISKFGGNPHKIYVAGHSAGAYLASMIFLDKKYLKQYNIDSDNLKGLFSFSGQMTTHFQICWEQTGFVTSSATTKVDEFAPLNYIRQTQKHLRFYVGDSILDYAGRFVQNKKIYTQLLNAGSKNTFFKSFKFYDHNKMEEPAELDAIKFLDSIK